MYQSYVNLFIKVIKVSIHKNYVQYIWAEMLVKTPKIYFKSHEIEIKF